MAGNKSYRKCIIYRGMSSLETLKAETKNKSNLQSFVSACKKIITEHTVLI